MLKLEQSRDCLEGHQHNNEANVKKDSIQDQNNITGIQAYQYGTSQPGDFTTDFLVCPPTDYYYYAGGPAQQQLDPIFFNWQPQVNGASDFNFASSGHVEHMGGALGYGQFDMLQMQGATGLMADYEYGMYPVANASNNHAPVHHQSHQYELSVPVKMPDAMLYPALDDPSANISSEAVLLNVDQQAGIFNDYFNLGSVASSAAHHHQPHPFYYSTNAEDGDVISHVKPSDVISPELFQSMHIPMVPIYGHYQGFLDKQQNGKKGSSSSSSSKKKKKPSSSTSSVSNPAGTTTIFGPSFFMKDGEEGASPASTSSTNPNGAVPSVIGEDGKVYTKPPYSYAALISRALRECDGAKLTLSGIYDWIKSNFPYYRTAEAAWQVLTFVDCINHHI